MFYLGSRVKVLGVYLCRRSLLTFPYCLVPLGEIKLFDKHFSFPFPPWVVLWRRRCPAFTQQAPAPCNDGHWSWNKAVVDALLVLHNYEWSLPTNYKPRTSSQLVFHCRQVFIFYVSTWEAQMFPVWRSSEIFSSPVDVFEDSNSTSTQLVAKENEVSLNFPWTFHKGTGFFVIFVANICQIL